MSYKVEQLKSIMQISSILLLIWEWKKLKNKRNDKQCKIVPCCRFSETVQCFWGGLGATIWTCDLGTKRWYPAATDCCMGAVMYSSHTGHLAVVWRFQQGGGGHPELKRRWLSCSCWAFLSLITACTAGMNHPPASWAECQKCEICWVISCLRSLLVVVT